MHIRSLITIAAIASLMLLFGGCSRTRIRLPIEEIDRPISLPRFSARIGLEGSALINSEEFEQQEHDLEPIVIYPHLWSGDKWEYFLPGVFRYYLVKNTEIRNNTLYGTGPNAAAYGGWTGVLYDKPIGYLFEFEAGLNYKRPLNDRLWFASDVQLTYETNTNIYGGWVQAGFGYQISRRLYATLKPSYSLYNPYVNDGNLISFPEITRYFTLPLLIGVNLTRSVSLYWQSSVLYYRNYHVNYGQNLGIYLTW